ncbi:hypothetical protein Hanom_Chr16g01523021 [Helianthus anomalus]
MDKRMDERMMQRRTMWSKLLLTFGAVFLWVELNAVKYRISVKDRYLKYKLSW